MEDIEPIFKFDGLKTYLRSIGLQVEEASSDGYRPVKPGDVTLEDIKNGTYTFESDGIYLNGSNGSTRKCFCIREPITWKSMASHECTYVDAVLFRAS